MLPELDDLAVVTMWSKYGQSLVAPEHAKAEHSLVKEERAIEIGHLKADLSESRLLRKPVISRPDASLQLLRPRSFDR
jgi:hypothetical protein